MQVNNDKVALKEFVAFLTKKGAFSSIFISQVDLNAFQHGWTRFP